MLPATTFAASPQLLRQRSGILVALLALLLLSSLASFGILVYLAVRVDSPVAVLQLPSSSSEASNVGPLILNLDMGLGVIQVPNEATYNLASGQLPDGLVPPNLTDPSNPIAGSVCPGCVPADTDDALVLAWALNLQERRDARIDLAGVAHTFGNADFAASAMSATAMFEHKGYVRELDSPGGAAPVAYRRFTNSAISAPVSIDVGLGSSQLPVVWPESTTTTYVVDGGERLTKLRDAWVGESYSLSLCFNAAVGKMVEVIRRAKRPVTIVATGPLQDVACLVRAYPEVIHRIAGIYILAGRQSGKGLVLSDNAGTLRTGLSDFNVRINPVAVQVLLQSGLRAEQLSFFPFELSSQFDTTISISQLLNASTPALRHLTSWKYIFSNNWLRAAFYDRVFGMGERIWPWDLMPFYYALEPSAFVCRTAYARLVWCESEVGYTRYQAPNNTCADHGKDIASMSNEAGQLWFRPEQAAADVPIAGERLVRVCDRWASDGARDAFIDEMLRESTH